MIDNRERIRSLIISPIFPLVVAYLVLGSACSILFGLDFFKDSQFISWGPPVTIMGKNITDQWTFYTLLITLFVHQMANTWVGASTYPFIINVVQNKNCRVIPYSIGVCLLIIIFNSIYSELDLLLIINGSTAQISFYMAIVAGVVISEMVVNYCHLREKKRENIYESIIN